MFDTAKARRFTRVVVPVAAIVGALAGLGACGDDDDNFVTPIVTGGVVTFKDSTFNFATLHTFKMPDTVVHFVPATGVPIDPSRQFDATILARVRADFLARGYLEVTDPAVTPSFVVLVGTTATTNFNAFAGYSWFGVWGFYPGWAFFPGFNTSWGIVYPWFPVVGVTAFDRGTLIVDLIPTASINPLNRTIQSAWTGVATALLNGTITTDVVNAAIDEMFRQSPYLTAPAPVLLDRR